MTPEEKKARHLEQMRQWRLKHPGYATAYAKRYAQEHREQVNQYRRTWYARHRAKQKKQAAIAINQNCCKECYNAYHSAWAKLNREKHRGYMDKWNAENQEKVREMKRNQYYRHREKRLRETAEWQHQHREELNERKRLKSKQEQDALLAQNPLIAIMQPHFVRRTGKQRKKPETT